MRGGLKNALLSCCMLCCATDGPAPMDAEAAAPAAEAAPAAAAAEAPQMEKKVRVKKTPLTVTATGVAGHDSKALLDLIEAEGFMAGGCTILPDHVW